MAKLFSQQLEELLNPLPKFLDPEDEGDEDTKAKVVERFQEDHVGEDGSAPSTMRDSAPPPGRDRYLGRKVSRKQLLMELEGSAGSEEEEEEDDDEEELEDDEGNDEDEEEELEDDEDNDEKEEDDDLILPRDVDFHKLTSGMDDLGVSEGDEESGEDDGGGSDGSGGEDGEDEDGVRTFSRDAAGEEVEKGMAVRNQLALWDRVLEGRIKVQKALLTANRLPQPRTFPEFTQRGGANFAGELKNARKALKALQRSLLELHDQLLLQTEETRAVVLGGGGGETGSDDSREEAELGREAGPPKRKLEMAEYPDFMAKRFAAFQPYRDATLQKWHDKTRLAAGRGGRGFGAFDRNILTQVEQVMQDRDRLVRRTQTQRSEYRILGKREAPPLQPSTPGEGGEARLKANAHLKDLDEDVFDDDDFYHQLLRELIERKTAAADANEQVAAGRQWLAIQKLRSKIRKKVDTKASKGRKVKFQVHNKLVNFMAPLDHSTLSDKGRTELYRGLFAQAAVAGE